MNWFKKKEVRLIPKVGDKVKCIRKSALFPDETHLVEGKTYVVDEVFFGVDKKQCFYV